jgi:hypothetical protein
MLVLARAGLSSYLYMLSTVCPLLSVLGVVSTPPHYTTPSAVVVPPRPAVIMDLLDRGRVSTPRRGRASARRL